MRTDEVAPRVIEAEPKPKLFRTLSLIGTGFGVIFFFWQFLDVVQRTRAEKNVGTWSWIYHAGIALIWLGYSIYCVFRFIAKVHEVNPSSRAMGQ